MTKIAPRLAVGDEFNLRFAVTQDRNSLGITFIQTLGTNYPATIDDADLAYAFDITSAPKPLAVGDKVKVIPRGLDDQLSTVDEDSSHTRFAIAADTARIVWLDGKNHAWITFENAPAQYPSDPIAAREKGRAYRFGVHRLQRVE